MRADLLGIVEVAYAPQRNAAEWLTEVARAAAPLLDQGQGIFASWFDVAASGRVEFPAPVLVNCAEAAWSLVMDAAAGLAPSEQAATLRQPAILVNTSERIGPRGTFRKHWLYAAFRRAGIGDYNFLTSVDLDGSGFVLGAPCVVTVRPSRRERRNWTLVTAHLRAGARLVGRHGAFAPHEPEAILNPDGRPVHAVGEARSEQAQNALRTAARAVDRARAALRRRDPDEALAVWRGLVAGRWSLVDEFDSDGRRFLVAKRNGPRPGPVASLTLPERQVVCYAALGHANKLIAYELGISQPSVSQTLLRAMLKLGATSRLALATLARAEGWICRAPGTSSQQKAPLSN